VARSRAYSRPTKNLRREAGVKRIHAMIVVALVILGARAACAQDVLTSTNGGMTVTDTVTTTDYGTTTITWLADANFAASLTPDSPYWVEGINPDGSMSLSTAVAFINQLNINSYLGINTWSLPTTIVTDTSCTLGSEGGQFGYNCGLPLGMDGMANPGHPYSELAGLFYNGLGGSAGNNILLSHNSNFYLFKNLQPYLYWSETAQASNNILFFANDFWFQNGFQGTEDEYDSMFVLPVSTTTTGQAPVTTLACPTTPQSCPYPYDPLNPLGLITSPLPPKLTLQEILGGRLVYDPTLDVSFLANANLAQTVCPGNFYYCVSGINPDGSMDIATLTNFLAALNNPDHPYLGITGWTIPALTIGVNNPDCTIQTTTKGGNPDYGYNCDGTASQLGELFYDQLGGMAGQSPPLLLVGSGPFQHFEPQPFFSNLQLNYYWQQCQTSSSTPFLPCNPSDLQSNGSFSFLSGYQGIQNEHNDLFVFLEVPGRVLFIRRPFPFPFPFPF
jgi:hypothetical protein